MYDNRQLTHNSQQQIDTNETQIGGRGTAFSSAACPNYLGCSRPSWGDLNDDSGWYQLAVDDFHICETCQEEAVPVGDEGHVRSRRDEDCWVGVYGCCGEVANIQPCGS